MKGHDTQEKQLKDSTIDVSLRGRIIKNGVRLWHLNSDFLKSWVHTRIEWPEGESGAFHLPVDAMDDYCQQLVAESRLVKSTGLVVWVQSRKGNRYLDAESLAAAAAHSLAVHTLQPQADEAGPEGAPAPQLAWAPAASGHYDDPRRTQPRPAIGWSGARQRLRW